MNVWAWEMGKPSKIECIGDMFQLLWLESVITEASLMTRNIKLPSIFMNFAGLGGRCPPSQRGQFMLFNSKIRYKIDIENKCMFEGLLGSNGG